MRGMIPVQYVFWFATFGLLVAGTVLATRYLSSPKVSRRVESSQRPPHALPEARPNPNEGGLPMESPNPTVRKADPETTARRPSGARTEAESYFQIGLSREEMFRFDEAIQQYDQAINENPAYAEAYAGRGRVKMKTDDYKGAIADLSKALHLNPNESEFYSWRAYANFYFKQYQSAMEDVNRALQLNPQDVQAYLIRASVRRDSAGTVADLEKSRELNPRRTAKDYDLLAKVEHKAGEYQKAVDAWSQTIQLNPQHASAYVNRGWCRYKLKDYDEAIADYRLAQDLCPSYRTRMSKYIEMAETEGKAREGLKEE